MEVDNKTIIIIGVLLMGFGALFVHYNDLALAVVSGLLGYLTKEAIEYVDNSNQDKEFNTDTVRQSDTTTEFNNEFIDLKNKYMNQIRNVYREFAMKFKECFYQVY